MHPALVLGHEREEQLTVPVRHHTGKRQEVCSKIAEALLQALYARVEQWMVLVYVCVWGGGEQMHAIRGRLAGAAT
jgi:hypothetical protein